MQTQTLLWLLAWVFIVGGLIGAFLPFIPGIAMMFIGMVMVAWIDDFQRVGYVTVGALLVFMLISHVIDYAASALGAKKMGASQYAIWGAVIGSIVGIFMGLVGMIFMPFFGAVIGEMFARWDIEQATRVGIGTWLGLIIGMAAKIAIAFTMLGVFCLSYYLTGNTV